VTLNGSSDIPQWSSWLNQPTAQIYHVSSDSRFPYWVTGAQQDSGAVGVRSRGKFGEISMRDWEPLCAGGESGYTAADPLHPGILFGGTVERCDLEINGPEANVSPERNMTPPARHDWTQPLVFSKADPRALYYANQFLYKTSDGGRSWKQISEDLTRPEPGVPPNLDPAAAAITDRNGHRGVIYTIAPSPVLVPMVWVGTDDGYIQVTMNDGASWQNVTPPAVNAWSRVTTIEASHVDFNEAYAAVDRHQLEDFEPYIYRTRDAGKSWQKITAGLAPGVYVHVVKEDPKRRGLLFAGTERGAYVSFDDGDSWQSLQLNLPVTSIRDFDVHGDDLVVATHGRGFWVIDYISPLRQIDALRDTDTQLLKPAEAAQVFAGTDNGTPLQKDEPQAENPPAGAFIDYYLRTAATGPVTIAIVDGSGRAVRTESSERRPVSAETPQTVSMLWRRAVEPLSAAAGLHRWVWDFRGDEPEPAGEPGRGGGAGRAGGAGRGGGGGGGRGRGIAPMVPPGEYTIKLTVNGKTYSQPLVVRPDPRLNRAW